MGTTNIRRRVVVHGRVQGVFFRDACRREAIRHDIRGWVQNTPDGTVEAAFEGPLPAVEAMVEWTRQGPPAATVSSVDVVEEEIEGAGGFDVRYG